MKTEEITKKKILTEQEVKLLKRRLNDRKITLEEIFGEDKTYKIDEAHTKKGLGFLMNQWKTPIGVERKNNPFGYREQEVLKNFHHFELREFHNNINSFQSQAGINNYVAVWTVVAKDKTQFKYYYDFKGVHIW